MGKKYTKSAFLRDDLDERSEITLTDSRCMNSAMNPCSDWTYWILWCTWFKIVNRVVLTGRNESLNSRVDSLVLLMHRNTRSFRSWWIKGPDRLLSRVDSLVPLMHHDSGSLGLWYINRLHEFSLRVEALAPLMHHDSGYLGSWCIHLRDSGLLSRVESLISLMHHDPGLLGSWYINTPVKS